jgi:hypothetical protein
MNSADSFYHPLNGLFNKPSAEEYWHYMAKHRSAEKDYQNQKNLEERIEQIRQKLGNCSFDGQSSDLLLTPLHVAVLSGNQPAIRFLLDKGAKVDIKDSFGKTAIHYARLLNPDLYPIFKENLGLSDEKESSANNPSNYFQTLIKDLYSFTPSPSPDPSFIASKIEESVYMGKQIGCAVDPFSPNFTSPPLSFLQPPSPSQIEAFIQKTIYPPVDLDKLPSVFKYDGTTNDFGIIIKQLLFCSIPKEDSELPLVIGTIIANMKVIAAHEEFDLVIANESYFLRDHFLKDKNGKIKVMGCPMSDEHKKLIQQALERGTSKIAYFEESPTYTTHYQCFAGTGGSTLQTKPLALSTYSNISRISLYIEGGNLLTLTNAKGQRKVLIGKDHLAQIHAQLRLEKHFEKNPPKDYTDELSKERIQEVAEEMYAMGLISFDFGKGRKTGFLSSQEINKILSAFHFEEERKLRFREVAIKQGAIPFQWNDKFVQEVEPAVRKYLAQRSKVFDYLSSILDVPPENIHFITQFAYHLDVFIKSGPKGSLFIQDFGYCIHVLEKIQKKQDFLAFTVQECIMVGRYLDTAKDLQEKAGPSLQQTKKELEQAGFIVIPTPGLFYDQDFYPAAPSYHLNFLNGISGWSPKQEHYFYITTGAQVGKHLSSLLSKLFTKSLQQYEPNLKVYFVGENPEKSGDFSRAMNLWNQVKKKGKLERGPMGGIHCLSFEQSAENNISAAKT